MYAVKKLILISIILLLSTSIYAANVDIDQAWFEANDGIYEGSDGDSLTLLEDVYMRRWGFITKNRDIKLVSPVGFNYTIYADTVYRPYIKNGSFETKDGNNKPVDWTVTDAESCFVEAGHWHRISETDPASLWDSSYAVVIHTPCPTQVLKTDDFYGFAPNQTYSIGVYAYSNWHNFVPGGTQYADGTGTTTTLIETNLIGLQDAHLNGGDINFYTGANAGEGTRSITAFNGTTGEITFDAYPNAVANGDRFAWTNVNTGDIRFWVALINAAGDSVVHHSFTADGLYARGFMRIWANYTTGDTTENFKVVVGCYGGDNAPTGKVYLDAVTVATSHNHGVVVGMDNTRIWTYVMTNHKTGNYMNEYTAAVADGWPTPTGTDGDGFIMNNIDIVYDITKPTFGTNAIHTFGQVTDVYIRNCDIVLSGVACRGWYADNAYQCRFSNGSIQHYGRGGLKRDWLMTSCIDFTANYSGYPYDWQIDSSTFYGGGQGVLNVKSGCDLTDNGNFDKPRGRIFDVELYPNAIQTNGFALMNYGEAGVYVDGLDIYGYSDSTWGRGIQTAGKTTGCYGGGTMLKNVNIIIAERLASSQEYETGISSYGIQLEDVGTCTLDNVNVIAISRAGDYNVGAMALRLNYDSNDSIHVLNSTFKAYALGDAAVGALQFGSIQEWAYDPDTQPRWVFTNNELVTNSIWFRNMAGSKNFIMDSTTLTVDLTTYDAWPSGDMKAFVGHTSYYPAVDSFKLINTMFGSADAADTLRAAHIYKYTTTTQYLDMETEWLLGWRVPIHVVDAGDNDVPSALVRVYSTVVGDTIYKGTTDANGYVYPLIWELRELALANDNPNRTSYNPGYSLIARYDEAETVDAHTIDSFAEREVTLQFSEIIIIRSVITKTLE